MRSKIYAIVATTIVFISMSILFRHPNLDLDGPILFILFLNIIIYSLTMLIYKELMNSQKKKEISKISNILQKAKDRYKMLLDNVSEGVLLVVGKDNSCKYANKAFFDLTEFSYKELLEENAANLFTSSVCKNQKNIEAKLKTKSGKIIDVVISVVSINILEETEFLVCVTDISEIKKLTLALKETSELSKATFESSDTGVLIIDAKNRKIQKINNSACKILGYKKEELLNSFCFCHICNYTNTDCERRIKTNNSFIEEEIVIRKDGSVVPVLRSISSTILEGSEHLIETIIDISAHKKIEESLFRSQKLESIGTLASGVAHEFNNVNAIIKGTIESIFLNESSNSIPSNIKQQLMTVKKMIERSSTLTNDLLVFSDNSHNGYEIFRLIEIVEQSLDKHFDNLKEYEIKTNINIPERSCAFANPEKIKSVFDNLIENAWQAMIESKTKQLTIDCSDLNGYLEVSIKDTGCGIKKENMNKVFDPFFSIKGIYADAGTSQSNFNAKGLGLSICQTILEKHHNGKIEIYSELNIGTVVKINIPMPTPLHVGEKGLPKIKTANILIIHQNKNIYETCEKIFKLCDFNSVICSSPEEVIAETKRNSFDLVLSDINLLSNMLIKQAIKEKPILALSEEKDCQIPKDLAVKEVFFKPYLLKSISWKVWEEIKKPARYLL